MSDRSLRGSPYWLRSDELILLYSKTIDERRYAARVQRFDRRPVGEQEVLARCARKTSTLRRQLMQAELANKEVDTEYKRSLAHWGPWKAMATAFGAGAAFMAVAIALSGLLLRIAE
jgi:hypothetical protein